MSRELTPSEIVSEIRKAVVRNASELGVISGLSSDIDALPLNSHEDIEGDPELEESFWSGYAVGEELKQKQG